MCRSQYVYRRLRRFKAGIESDVSWLKRCLGLSHAPFAALKFIDAMLVRKARTGPGSRIKSGIKPVQGNPFESLPPKPMVPMTCPPKTGLDFKLEKW